MMIKDLFDYKYGVNLELINCQETNKEDNDSVNFVARTSVNNGVTARVKIIGGLTPQKAGTLSLAVSGSVLSCFVQTEDYYSGRDLYVLTPKIELTLEQKLFYAMCITKNAYRYSYGRAANKTFPNIEIPELEECNRIITDLKVKKIKTNNISSNKALRIEEWKEFKIGDLFQLKKCKCSKAGELENGNEILYIGAKKENNGIMKSVCKIDSLISNGNCIIFICDGQGSVGYSNYMESDFIGSTTLTAGYNMNLNKYNALFIVSVLDKERYKYSYGRKYGPNLKKSIIKLPAIDNQPDWQFMEDYIKSLQFADRI